MALNAPYTQNTVIQSTQVSNDLLGLADGSNDVTANKLATFRDETFFDHVGTGLLWTGDSLGVNRNASMSSGVVMIDGLRAPVSAVVARTFTASKDTYIDVGSTGTITYTEVSNNAASPALTASNIRIGIIITGATTIANAGSINQGQGDKVLPIASSIPYATTDSLGNLICNRDKDSKLLGMRRLITTQTTSSQTNIQMTAISVPFLPPANRKVIATLVVPKAQKDVAPSQYGVGIWDGTVGSGTLLQDFNGVANTISVNYNMGNIATDPHVPSAGLHTYNGCLRSDPGGPNTVIITGATTGPIYLRVELY